MQVKLDVIKRGAHEVLPEKELIQKLQENRPLRIKVGFDPTAADLHFGHTVLLTKMRHLQLLGHEIYFLVGDFTGLIGDPSGRDVTRKPLTSEELKQNAITYTEQVFKILDPKKTKVLYNSEWLGKLTSADMLRLASCATVARMLERDDFEKRYKTGCSIGIHEFLYPLIQGYDSVAMDTDIELGGTDQKFNLLMGRELQKQHGQSQQVILTMPILEGLDGVKKMSKSLGNYIGINDAPEEMFGKIMSISDELMWRYFELLSLKSAKEIQDYRDSIASGKNPKDVKIALALELVTRYHSNELALAALEDFKTRFQKNMLPENIPEFPIKIDTPNVLIANVMKQVGLIPSTSEGLRLIDQKAIKVDSVLVTDKKMLLMQGKTYVLQVGKRRFAKVRL
ncbi:MAG: tyrosine--tRNA ligase [Thiotrichales bacterium]|nr:MAG: tyrosine--tRNA ligase [Thiotrichales bacterium]